MIFLSRTKKMTLQASDALHMTQKSEKKIHEESRTHEHCEILSK